MEFSRQEYWTGLPSPPPGNFPKPGIEPRSPASQADSLPLSHLGSPLRLPPALFSFPSFKSLAPLLPCLLRWGAYTPRMLGMWES